MTKYVKLKADRSDFDSAIYATRPRQLRSLSVSDYRKHHWFMVEEHYQPRTDAQLYRYVRKSWELQEDGKVHIFYEPELVNLEMRRRIMSDRVTEVRNRQIATGVKIKGFLFDTRPETYVRVAGSVIKAMRDEEFGTPWITEDNQTVMLTNKDILDLGDAYADYEVKNIMFARSLKDQVEASDTPEEFDIHDGWPSNEYYAEETLPVINV